MKTKISKIVVGDKHAKLKEWKVNQFVEKLSIVGQTRPILITQDYELIDGLHRLKACERLRWEVINARVLIVPDNFEAEDKIYYKLIELCENLSDDSRSHLEKALLYNKLKKLYEKLHPETMNNISQAIGMHKALNHKVPRLSVTSETSEVPEYPETRTKSFVKDFAEKSQNGETAIKEGIRIAENIFPDVIEKIMGTALADKKSELLLLAKEPKDMQAEIVDLIISEKSEKVNEAKNLIYYQQNDKNDIKSNIKPLEFDHEFGKVTQIHLPGMTSKYITQYSIVEFRDLICSHEIQSNYKFTPNKRYNRIIQDRNYSHDEIVNHIYHVYDNLKSELLLTDSAYPTAGSPVIALDGTVLAGNCRVLAMSIDIHTNKINYTKYKKSLYKEAVFFGFDSKKLIKFEIPIMVRICNIESDTEEAISFGHASNDTIIGSRTLVDEAAYYAYYIKDTIFSAFNMNSESENLSQFIRKIHQYLFENISKIIPSSIPLFFKKDKYNPKKPIYTDLTPTGYALIKKIFLILCLNYENENKSEFDVVKAMKSFSLEHKRCFDKGLIALINIISYEKNRMLLNQYKIVKVIRKSLRYLYGFSSFKNKAIDEFLKTLKLLEKEPELFEQYLFGLLNVCKVFISTSIHTQEKIPISEVFRNAREYLCKTGETVIKNAYTIGHSLDMDKELGNHNLREAKDINEKLRIALKNIIDNYGEKHKIPREAIIVSIDIARYIDSINAVELCLDQQNGIRPENIFLLMNYQAKSKFQNKQEGFRMLVTKSHYDPDDAYKNSFEAKEQEEKFIKDSITVYNSIFTDEKINISDVPTRIIDLFQMEPTILKKKNQTKLYDSIDDTEEADKPPKTISLKSVDEKKKQEQFEKEFKNTVLEFEDNNNPKVQALYNKIEHMKMDENKRGQARDLIEQSVKLAEHISKKLDRKLELEFFLNVFEEILSSISQAEG